MDEDGEGLDLLLKIGVGIAALYGIASIGGYLYVRLAADTNNDKKVTAAEFNAKKAELITGVWDTVLTPGITFVETIVTKVWAYDVLPVAP